MAAQRQPLLTNEEVNALGSSDLARWITRKIEYTIKPTPPTAPALGSRSSSDSSLKSSSSGDEPYNAPIRQEAHGPRGLIFPSAIDLIKREMHRPPPSPPKPYEHTMKLKTAAPGAWRP